MKLPRKKDWLPLSKNRKINNWNWMDTKRRKNSLVILKESGRWDNWNCTIVTCQVIRTSLQIHCYERETKSSLNWLISSVHEPRTNVGAITKRRHANFQTLICYWPITRLEYWIWANCTTIWTKRRSGRGRGTNRKGFEKSSICFW